MLMKRPILPTQFVLVSFIILKLSKSHCRKYMHAYNAILNFKEIMFCNWIMKILMDCTSLRMIVLSLIYNIIRLSLELS